MNTPLTFEQRCQIVRGVCHQKSMCQIAKSIGCATSTVSKLMKRLEPDPLNWFPSNINNLITRMEIQDRIKVRSTEKYCETQLRECRRCHQPLMPSREVCDQGFVNCLECPICGEVIFPTEVQ